MRRLLDCAKVEFQQRTHRVSVLPIIILYLNNVCDSRCVTCSIWKNNDTLKIPEERQMSGGLLNELYGTLGRWRPRQIILSGGEPALHPRFPEAIKRFASLPSFVGVVTNGLLLSSLERDDLNNVSEFYISFDGPDRESYESIRGVDGFERLVRSVAVLQAIVPRPKIVARCTLQRANVGRLPDLVSSARQIGFDTISFLGVDLSSRAFARDLHGVPDDGALRPTADGLGGMESGIEVLRWSTDGFIEGGTARLERILQYFRALAGENKFPDVRCNAPWVSAVIETTGQIRGCFFHPIIGDFRNMNGETATRFRRSLDVSRDATCRRCVCSKLLDARDIIRM